MPDGLDIVMTRDVDRTHVHTHTHAYHEHAHVHAHTGTAITFSKELKYGLGKLSIARSTRGSLLAS